MNYSESFELLYTVHWIYSERSPNITIHSESFELHGLASIWEHQQKRKVATKTNSYKIYREILFQKVASGYLLHFVQDGSSKNALEK